MSETFKADTFFEIEQYALPLRLYIPEIRLMQSPDKKMSQTN